MLDIPDRGFLTPKFEKSKMTGPMGERDYNPINNKTYFGRFRAVSAGRLGPVDTFNILDSQLCAVGEEGSDSCNGDRGGPIFLQVKIFLAKFCS